MADDPDWYRLLLDSVSTGTARLQYRSGSEMPFSQRLNLGITSRLTIRAYQQAGPEKSRETGNFTLNFPFFSVTSGPVLISHAFGFITGRATPRQKPYPGMSRLKSMQNLRTTPCLSSPFSGFAKVSIRNTTFSAYSSREGPGFSATYTASQWSVGLFRSTDLWTEGLFQIEVSRACARFNVSLRPGNKQTGHLFSEILFTNPNSGYRIIFYTISRRFNPLYGRNPWFSGDPAGCTGGGAGLRLKPKRSLSLQAIIIQQTGPSGEDLNLEIALRGSMDSFQSGTLLRHTLTRTLKKERAPLSLFCKPLDHLLTVKQTFDILLTEGININTLWAVAVSDKNYSSAGLISITYHTANKSLRVQLSRSDGGTADLWYTRPLAGTQVILQKAKTEPLMACDIATSVNFGSVAITQGLSLSKQENRITFQLKIALDTANS